MCSNASLIASTACLIELTSSGTAAGAEIVARARAIMRIARLRATHMDSASPRASNMASLARKPSWLGRSVRPRSARGAVCVGQSSKRRAADQQVVDESLVVLKGRDSQPAPDRVGNWGISVGLLFGVAVDIRHRDDDAPRWERSRVSPTSSEYALAGIWFPVVQSATVHGCSAVPKCQLARLGPRQGSHSCRSLALD